MHQRSWLQRLTESVFSLLIVALAVHWAWQLLEPLLPVLVALLGGGLMWRLLFGGRR